jgi:hypothetical protein
MEQKKDIRKALRVEKDFFADFKSGEPYQVSIPFLEQITSFSFGVKTLHQPYTKTEPSELIFKRVEIPFKKSALRITRFTDQPLSFAFTGIRL